LHARTVCALIEASPSFWDKSPAFLLTHRTLLHFSPSDKRILDRPSLVVVQRVGQRQGGVVANKNLGALMTAIKAKQMRRSNMIAESLAALAPALGAPPPDRLGPVLAYMQTLQGQSEKKPGIAERRHTALRPRAARASSDISIGEKL